MTQPRDAVPLRSDYRPYVGKTFTATQGSRTYRLRLDAVRPMAGADRDRRDSSFNLIFSSPSLLPDAIYSLCRPGVPAHQLFMSGDVESGAMRAAIRQDSANRR